MGTIVELYGAADLQRLENRIRRGRAAMLGLGVSALALLVALCCLTGTANARRMEAAAIAVSTVAGWILLYLRRFVVAEGRTELRHARMLGETEKEILRGRVTVTQERVRIPGSIRLRRVLVETEAGTRRVSVNETRAAVLAAAGKELELHVANGYVAAYRAL